MHRIIALALAAAALPGAATAATSFADGSFEAQGAASTGNYCYFGWSAAGNPACAGGAWMAMGLGGIQKETNTAWPGTPAAEGDYYGFVQMDGILGQVFTADTGSYTLRWSDAGRPSGVSGGNQSYDVLLADVTRLDQVTNLGSYSTVANQAWSSHSTASFGLEAGKTYVIGFAGKTSSDETAFIDTVELQAAGAVPEPATWGLMLLGFGIVGAAMRRQRWEQRAIA
jgi:hypothetical protein